ncbi:hypothetical protein H5410_006778, partial [Solanum commersonii]
ATDSKTANQHLVKAVETSWRQKSRCLWLKGGRNTYFQKMANSHRKSNCIDKHRVGDAIIEDTDYQKGNPTLWGGLVVWAWDFHAGGLKFETPGHDGYTMAFHQKTWDCYRFMEYGLLYFWTNWVMPQNTKEAFENWRTWKVDRAIRKIWRMIPASIFWVLWTERNRRCFDGASTPNQSIKVRCLMFLSNWHNLLPVDFHDNFLLSVSSLILDNRAARERSPSPSSINNVTNQAPKAVATG